MFAEIIGAPSPYYQSLEGGVWHEVLEPTYTRPSDPRWHHVLIVTKRVSDGMILNVGYDSSGDGTNKIKFPSPAELTPVRVYFQSCNAAGDQNPIDANTPYVALTIGRTTGVLDLGVATEGTLQTSAFAYGTKPLELVTSLPVDFTNYPSGSVVVLTTNKKTYKSNGSAWSEIPITDVALLAYAAIGIIAAGAITTTQFAAQEVLVGLGGDRPTKFRVNDALGNILAFFGYDSVSGFSGGYLKNCRIGTSINDPEIYADASGVTITDADITIQSGSKSVEIDDANLVKVSDSGLDRYAQVDSWRVMVKDASDPTSTQIYVDEVRIVDSDGDNVARMLNLGGGKGYLDLLSIAGGGPHNRIFFNGSTGIGYAPTLSCEDEWDAGHLILGSHHIWVDASGKLRIKGSAPSSDTDGTVVGDQAA
jgi:hypothetical protein